MAAITVPPPDGGYGWIVVMASFGCFSLIGTHFAMFSLLYRPVVEAYDTSYAVAGLAGSIALCMVGLPGNLFVSLKSCF